MEFAKLVIRREGHDPTEVVLGIRTGIGRGPGNEVRIEDPRISRQHALIRRQDVGYILSDLGSANGTSLNGRRTLVPERLWHNDVVAIGNATLTFLHLPSQRGREHADQEEDATLTGGNPANDEVTVIGTGPAMEAVFRLMQKASASSIPVLISGETGTGKELVAHAIHHVGPRGRGPFIPINCAALPETLLESQLFGHRRGSFTGATQDRAGLFEAADGGTIFLDEIGEMPLAMQPKLLRVLQEGEVVPIGETRPHKVDVRVISATNRDLGAEVAGKTFREDLYYRLSAFPIALPALRERTEDIPVLAERFATIAAHRHRKRLQGISDEAMACLLRYPWPGNVRELQNEIQRAVVLTEEGERVGLAHLSHRLTGAPPPPPGSSEPEGGAGPDVDEKPGALTLDKAREEFEARHIAEVLRQHGGNVSRAAEALGVSRGGLHRKIREYGIREGRDD